ncbi:MAG: ABC transporter permease [Clostridia bacterium]
MLKTWSIFKREVAAYFLSPIAYVMGAVFLVLSGYFFSILLFATRSASMQGTLGNMAVTFIFVAPVLTMRLLAEERKLGTDELLLTSPVTITSIVVGKYLASVFTYLVFLAVTLAYPAILRHYGSPDMGPIYSGYLGMFLFGAACLSAGTFASALTENQMVAGMVGFGILLLFWIMGWVSAAVTGPVGEAVSALSILKHFDDFQKGIVDLSHTLYYLSFVFVFLFLAVRTIDSRRWSA